MDRETGCAVCGIEPENEFSTRCIAHYGVQPDYWLYTEDPNNTYPVTDEDVAAAEAFAADVTADQESWLARQAAKEN